MRAWSRACWSSRAFALSGPAPRCIACLACRSCTATSCPTRMPARIHTRINTHIDTRISAHEERKRDARKVEGRVGRFVDGVRLWGLWVGCVCGVCGCVGGVRGAVCGFGVMWEPRGRLCAGAPRRGSAAGSRRTPPAPLSTCPPRAAPTG
eukprot:412342-Rhodomonas_salina.1